jgi:hypothetical protein
MLPRAGRALASGLVVLVRWTLRAVLLALQIIIGAAALVLGGLALIATPRRHNSRTALLNADLWAVFATCLTGARAVLTGWSRLWGILPLAVVSYLGRWLTTWRCITVGRRGSSRMAWVVPIALVTALLVVNARDISTIAELIACVHWRPSEFY